MANRVALGIDTSSGSTAPIQTTDTLLGVATLARASSGSAGAVSLYADAYTTAITIGGGSNQTTVAIGKTGQNVTVNGPLIASEGLTVNGTTTTISTTNLAIDDDLIILRDGASTGDEAGIAFERGSTGDDAILLWNEVDDRFEIGLFDTSGGTTAPTSALGSLADFRCKNASFGPAVAATAASLYVGDNSSGNRSATFRLVSDDTYSYGLQIVKGAGPNAAGSFTVRGTGGLDIETTEAGAIRFGTTNINRWVIDSSGHLVTGLDDSYDIGASGDTRPRTVYIGTSAVVGDTVTITSNKIEADEGTAFTIQTADSTGATNCGNIYLEGGAGNAGGGAPGDAYVLGGDAAGGTVDQGGDARLLGGAGDGAATGGWVYVTGGAAGSTGIGGTVYIDGGASTNGSYGGPVYVRGGVPATSGNGGPVSIQGADAAGTNKAGGNVEIVAGDSTTSTTGGSVTVTAGTSVSNGAGGAVTLTAGSGGSANGVGGAASLTGGASPNGTAGGAASLIGGAATVGVGGAVSIASGVGASADGAVTISSNSADMTLTARDGSITLNQSGSTSLSGFTATSIVGALNELKAAIPSGGIVLLGSATGIDASSTGTTSIVTVASSTKAVITGCLVYCSVGSPSTPPTCSVGYTASDYNDVFATASLDGLVVNTSYQFPSEGGSYKVVPGGPTPIYLNISVAASGAQTISVYLFGFLV